MSNNTEDKVVDLLRARGAVGREKYKQSMDRTDYTPVQWVQHYQEEMLDGAQYAERLRGMLELWTEMTQLINKLALSGGQIVYYNITLSQQAKELNKKIHAAYQEIKIPQQGN